MSDGILNQQILEAIAQRMDKLETRISAKLAEVSASTAAFEQECGRLRAFLDGLERRYPLLLSAEVAQRAEDELLRLREIEKRQNSRDKVLEN